MIKIIEPGTIERKRCKSCGCLFSYKKEDIKHNTFCGFSEYNYDYIICPQCKKEIQLDTVKRVTVS